MINNYMEIITILYCFNLSFISCDFEEANYMLNCTIVKIDDDH